MKKLINSILIVVLAVIMAVSSLIVVAAEETTTTSDDGTEIVIIDDGDGTRAYELVWKFKIENSHLYKRRWNRTLGAWYDSSWILVY